MVASLREPWNPLGLRPALRRFRALRAARDAAVEVKLAAKRLRQKAHIAAYLRQHQLRCLQIGAGPTRVTGWLCTDLRPRQRGAVYLDATQPFPIPGASFDFVDSEHMIEHISFAEGLAMLRECHRILKPGGRVRIATPDLGRLLRTYGGENEGIAQRYLEWIARSFLSGPEHATPVFVINNAFRNWGHQFLYDEETLRGALLAAGFADVRRYAPGESGNQVFRDLERHGHNIGDEEINQFETMVLEAERP